MNHPNELILDKGKFLALRAQCELVIDLDKRLPEFVFKRKFDRYYAIERSHTLKKSFANFLSALANVCQEETIHYMTVEPDPFRDYYLNLGFFGIACFSATNLVDRYISVMSNNQSGNSFFVWGGDIGVFWGPSLQWAIFYDRISWELALIAVTGDIDMPSTESFQCMSPDLLSNYMHSQYHWNHSIADSFMSRFLANYRI